jgi:predicted transcriptional regulator
MKRSKIEQVRKLLENNPKIKTEDVCKQLDIAKSYAYVLMSKARTAYLEEHGHTINSKMAEMKRLGKRLEVARPISNLPKGMTVAEADEIVADVNQAIAQHDAVNHPAHYTTGGIETIDFIEAKKLGYNLGNVVKYITRSGLKGNQLEDLRKAQWYLSREIATLK